MVIWIDAQLSPEIASFITSNFGITAYPLRDLHLRDAKDLDIFMKAREANAVVMTKDQDFSILLDRFGPPPQILWITCGNTSNEYLCNLLSRTFPSALIALEAGEALVEIV